MNSELEPLKVILYNAIFYDGLKKIHHKDDLQDINLVLLKYDFKIFQKIPFFSSKPRFLNEEEKAFLNGFLRAKFNFQF